MYRAVSIDGRWKATYSVPRICATEASRGKNLHLQIVYSDAMMATAVAVCAIELRHEI